jgi:hypothetical protein
MLEYHNLHTEFGGLYRIPKNSTTVEWDTISHTKYALLWSSMADNRNFPLTSSGNLQPGF